MKKELCMKQIFDDFVHKVMLSDTEIEVLELYIKNESIVSIATKTSQSTSSVSRIIFNLKEKYSNYKKIELAKLQMLK